MNLKLSVITLAISGTLLTTSAQATNQEQAKQAFDQLSSQAISKIREANIDVDALLTNESNDLIIHLDEESFAKTNTNKEGVAPRTYKLVKDNVLGALSNTILMRDYYASPTSFVRVQSKKDLVNLLNNPNVKSIVHNHILKPSLKESLNYIHQPEARKLTFKPKGDTVTSNFDGKGSVVAILDTGLNPTLEDFGDCSLGLNTSKCKVAKIIEIAKEKDGSPDGEYDDGSHHGSNVSAIVGAVAPKAKLVALDVFSWSHKAGSEKKVHTTPYSAVSAGLNWVKNNHISNNPKGFNFVAANMSLGSSSSNTTATSELPIIARLKSLNVATVVASGNDEYTDGIGWPASERGAIAVGAVYDRDYPEKNMKCDKNAQSGLQVDEVTCFSNSGTLLQFLAPGYNITAGGETMSGTSQATPHVAGAIAVLRAPAVLRATKQIPLDYTLGQLARTGKKITDYRNGLVRPRIDLLAAVEDIANNKPIVPITPITPVKPIYPIKPVKPIYPIKPVKPIYPIKPGPDKPTRPIYPPIKPVKPIPTYPIRPNPIRPVLPRPPYEGLSNDQ